MDLPNRGGAAGVFLVGVGVVVMAVVVLSAQ